MGMCTLTGMGACALLTEEVWECVGEGGMLRKNVTGEKLFLWDFHQPGYYSYR